MVKGIYNALSLANRLSVNRKKIISDIQLFYKLGQIEKKDKVPVVSRNRTPHRRFRERKCYHCITRTNKFNDTDR